MNPRLPLIEPGLLPVFRLYLVIQWIILSLTIWAAAGSHKPLPDLLSVYGWWEATFLLGYIAWGRLQRWLGRAYLPIALGIATLLPIYAQAASVAWKLNMGLRGQAAAVDSSLLYLWLLLPLLLISAQYRMWLLFVFTGGTTFLTIALNGYLADVGGPSVTHTVQEAGGRFVVFSLVGVIVVRLSAAQRAYRAQLAQQQAQLAQYALTMEQLAVTRERNRLARDLHDTLAHTLSAVSVQLQALDVLWERDPPAAREVLRQTTALTRSGLNEARGALHALRANPLGELGLALALERLADQAAQRAGLRLAFAAPPVIRGLRADVEQQFYRIAEEALNNVVRHANAQQVMVTLAQAGATWTLIIADDGQGFDLSKATRPGHFGLTGIHERAALIGATLTAESRPGAGTTVRVEYSGSGVAPS
jgi:signal transduction histidine kinase